MKVAHIKMPDFEGKNIDTDTSDVKNKSDEILDVDKTMVMI